MPANDSLRKPIKITCVFCGGTGHGWANPYEPCPICNGRTVLTLAGNPVLHTCTFCGGTAHGMRKPYAPCEVCKGIGNLAENDKPPTITTIDSLPPLHPLPPTALTLVANSRLDELRACTPIKLDFKKLIRLCEELNTAYSQGCYLAVIMLTRSLLDHVPPVFGKTTFAEVVNNYSGGKSFTESMQFLQGAARKIADAHLHRPMRAAETLPTPQQVNFASHLDVLLEEIVRITRLPPLLSALS